MRGWGRWVGGESGVTEVSWSTAVVEEWLESARLWALLGGGPCEGPFDCVAVAVVCVALPVCPNKGSGLKFESEK
jgi:hypothetical protein